MNIKSPMVWFYDILDTHIALIHGCRLGVVPSLDFKIIIKGFKYRVISLDYNILNNTIEVYLGFEKEI